MHTHQKPHSTCFILFFISIYFFHIALIIVLATLFCTFCILWFAMFYRPRECAGS